MDTLDKTTLLEYLTNATTEQATVHRMYEAIEHATVSPEFVSYFNNTNKVELELVFYGSTLMLNDQSTGSRFFLDLEERNTGNCYILKEGNPSMQKDIEEFLDKGNRHYTKEGREYKISLLSRSASDIRRLELFICTSGISLGYVQSR